MSNLDSTAASAAFDLGATSAAPSVLNRSSADPNSLASVIRSRSFVVVAETEEHPAKDGSSDWREFIPVSG